MSAAQPAAPPRVVVTATRAARFAQTLRAGRHELVSDEPERLGGDDTGPNPQQLLALSLAACTAATVELYAAAKDWEVGAVEVEVAYDPPPRGERARFAVRICLPAPLSEEQRRRLEVVAGKCPVHRVLAGGAEVRVGVDDESAPR